MAYLNTMVLRGAAPRRGAKKHAAPRGIGANLKFGRRRLFLEKAVNCKLFARPLTAAAATSEAFNA